MLKDRHLYLWLSLSAGREYRRHGACSVSASSLDPSHGETESRPSSYKCEIPAWNIRWTRDEWARVYSTSVTGTSSTGTGDDLVRLPVSAELLAKELRYGGYYHWHSPLVIKRPKARHKLAIRHFWTRTCAAWFPVERTCSLSRFRGFATVSGIARHGRRRQSRNKINSPSVQW